MYKRVLLAYDGSREGRAALREGALLARDLGAQLFLLAVVPLVPADAAAGVTPTQLETYESILHEGVTRAKEYGFSIEGQIVQGEPVDQIAAYAVEIGADLVVVGHRRKGFFARWWTGSTQTYLMDLLDCSILVAQNEVAAEPSAVST